MRITVVAKEKYNKHTINVILKRNIVILSLYYSYMLIAIFELKLLNFIMHTITHDTEVTCCNFTVSHDP